MPRRHGNDKGPSRRQLRVGELVRRALSEILTRGDVHGLDPAAITITEVRPGPDLRHGTVYYAPLTGKARPKDETALKQAAPYLRGQVSKVVSLKFSMDFRFVPDESFDEGSHIDAILHSPRVVADVAAPDAGEDVE